ncbi:hypothetical protein ACET65_19845 [Aeromonas rivipollensis]
MTNLNFLAMAQDPANWVAMSEMPSRYPQFSKATLKHLFWKRAERPGLERCSRMIGKKLFINVPMFGLWMAGALPEQQGE